MEDQVKTERDWILEAIMETVERQRAQLALALSILADLGFEMSDFADALLA